MNGPAKWTTTLLSAFLLTRARSFPTWPKTGGGSIINFARAGNAQGEHAALQRRQGRRRSPDAHLRARRQGRTHPASTRLALVSSIRLPTLR